MPRLEKSVRISSPVLTPAPSGWREMYLNKISSAGYSVAPLPPLLPVLLAEFPYLCPWCNLIVLADDVQPEGTVHTELGMVLFDIVA